MCAVILTGLLTHLDSFRVHFRLWPFLMCLLLSYDSSPLSLWLRVSLSLSFLSFWGKFDLFEAAWQSSYDSFLRQQDCESNHSLVYQKQTCCSLSSQLWWDTMWLIWVPSTACVCSLSRSWLIKMNQGIKPAENYRRRFSDMILLKGILRSYAALLKRFWAVHISHNSLKSKDSFVAVDFIHFFMHVISLINTTK